MILKTATLKDLNEIMDLNKKWFLSDNVFDKTLNMNWTFSKKGIEYFKKVLTDKLHKVFIYKENDKIIAYAITSIKPGDQHRKIKKVVEVDNIFIEEKYRKLGLGKKLFEAAKKYAKENNINTLRVCTMAENKNAIGFYNYLGFSAYSIKLEKEI